MVDVVMEFFVIGEIPVAWMRTYVILIPKKLDAAESSHYRPISLCTILYNCAKSMLERMKPILACFICYEQGTFIGG